MLMTASLFCARYSLSPQNLALLEDIAIKLYSLHCIGRKGNLIYFACLANWVGIKGNEFWGVFFKLNIPPHTHTVISYIYFL